MAQLATLDVVDIINIFLVLLVVLIACTAILAETLVGTLSEKRNNIIVGSRLSSCTSSTVYVDPTCSVVESYLGSHHIT